MNPAGWIPSSFVWHGATAAVRWTLLGRERLLDPFFQDTMAKQMQQPFHHLFRLESTPGEMVEWMMDAPTVPLRGIILHTSRCGSTLMAQMLASCERNVVASEPSPFDGVVLARRHDPGLARTTQVAWLRGMAAALGQARAGSEEAFFLKLDCWHAAHVALLREAFPDVPLLFLYRDPVEVLVSHHRVPALWTLPHVMKMLGLLERPEEWNPQRREEYCARALAAICAAGLEAAEHDGALLVNYEELPEVMSGRVLRHFHLRPEDVPVMLGRAALRAKSPQEAFAPDVEGKQAAASEQVRVAAAEHLTGIYQRLEAERARQSAQ